jgi:NAD(P)H-hydrate epimerase
VLAALGAGRGGAGLVRLAVPERILPWVVPAVPFAIVLPGRGDGAGRLSAADADAIVEAASAAQALVLGPGLGDDPATGDLVAALLQRVSAPVVLDADGLNHVARLGLGLLSGRSGVTLLTPHPGEFSRLAGGGTPKDDDRAPRAAELARRTGAVVVLKGHRTVVTDGARLYVESAGNAGMATGGMGDVLSGLLGALLAVRSGPAETAALGVRLHALAGDLAAQELGEAAVLPEDVALRLGRVARGLQGRPAGS